MTSEDPQPQPSPAYLPSGQPAPLILSEQELISLLRLDGEDGSKDPHLTLQYYRSRGLKTIQGQYQRNLGRVSKFVVGLKHPDHQDPNLTGRFVCAAIKYLKPGGKIIFHKHEYPKTKPFRYPSLKPKK